MIISVDKAKQLVNLNGWDDAKIDMKLKAIEQTIRAYTNNNFQNRCIRSECSVSDGFLHGIIDGFSVGDTVQISESRFNGGLHVISSVDDDSIDVGEMLVDEDRVLVTKVEYPADVIAAAVNLMEWEVNNRSKVGVQSETLSRHSVTYFNMDSANQIMGYPASLLGCLRAYRKARS